MKLYNQDIFDYNRRNPDGKTFTCSYCEAIYSIPVAALIIECYECGNITKLEKESNETRKILR